MKKAHLKTAKEQTTTTPLPIKPNVSNNDVILHWEKNLKRDDEGTIPMDYEEAMVYTSLTRYYSRMSARYLNRLNNIRNDKRTGEKVKIVKFPRRFHNLIQQVRSYYQAKLNVLSSANIVTAETTETSNKNKKKNIAKDVSCITCMQEHGPKSCTFCSITIGHACC